MSLALVPYSVTLVDRSRGWADLGVNPNIGLFVNFVALMSE